MLQAIYQAALAHTSFYMLMIWFMLEKAVMEEQ